MTATVSQAAQLKIVQLIAQELGARPPQVAAAMALLDADSARTSADPPRKEEKPRLARAPAPRPASAMALAFEKLRK